MKKKYNPEAVRLDAYERSIDDVVNYNKLKKPTTQRQKELKSAASNTPKALKDARANIRMNGHDMLMLKQKAQEAGLPYQTLIAHVMHLYLTDQLVNLKEVEKMIDAGMFNRRKTG